MGCRYLWVSKPWSSEVSKNIWLPNHGNPGDFSEVADTSCGNVLWNKWNKRKVCQVQVHAPHFDRVFIYEVTPVTAGSSNWCCSLQIVYFWLLCRDSWRLLFAGRWESQSPSSNTKQANHPTSQHAEEPQHHVPRSSGGRCRWIPVAKSSVMCWGSSFSNSLHTILFSALYGSLGMDRFQIPSFLVLR